MRDVKPSTAAALGPKRKAGVLPQDGSAALRALITTYDRRVPRIRTRLATRSPGRHNCRPHRHHRQPPAQQRRMRRRFSRDGRNAVLSSSAYVARIGDRFPSSPLCDQRDTGRPSWPRAAITPRRPLRYRRGRACRSYVLRSASSEGCVGLCLAITRPAGHPGRARRRPSRGPRRIPVRPCARRSRFEREVDVSNVVDG